MKLGAIWRYPVESMAGERLPHAAVGVTGLSGDRILQVYDRQGRIVTARRFSGLLRLRATLGGEGEPLVDGLPWNSPGVVRRVEAAVAPGARLQRLEGEERFDVLPLLICTDGAVSLFGRDVRRLRPNLLIEGVAGVAERDWEGAILRVGDVLVGLADLRARCVMTTVDPDTGDQDPAVLRHIVRNFGGRLCLNARAATAGVWSVSARATDDRVFRSAQLQPRGCRRATDGVLACRREAASTCPWHCLAVGAATGLSSSITMKPRTSTVFQLQLSFADRVVTIDLRQPTRLVEAHIQRHGADRRY